MAHPGDHRNGTTYATIGNPLTYKDYAMTWSGRQLTSMGDWFEYAYNADGIRTSKTVLGTKHTYTLNSSQIVAEAFGNILLVTYTTKPAPPSAYNIAPPPIPRMFSTHTIPYRYIFTKQKFWIKTTCITHQNLHPYMQM